MSQLPFPRAILSQHSATLGKTGAGKSSALRVSVEDILAQKKRVVVIDPKGDWWGLKSDSSGKGPGFPIITFGDFKEPYGQGDVPINERSGTHVAELIASGNRPCIIGFRGWMPGHMMQFWIGQGNDPHRADGFLPTLFNKNEGELYVFVDEVQNFAAKGKILSPQAGLCVHWTNKAMSESRGMGMTFHIASQRSQKVHNDTLDCCETLIGMRTAHPAARKSIEDWINSKGDPTLGKEVLGTLAELNRGAAWVWSPENEFGPRRVQFPMFATFDSFAPPQLQKKVSQAGWSEIDLDEVRGKLATVIAEQDANDPKKLKAQVAQLRKELLAAQKAQPEPTATTGKVDPEREKKIAERAAKAATLPILKRLHEFQKLAKKIGASLFDATDALQKLANAELEPVESAPLEMPPRTVSRVATVPAPVQSRPRQRETAAHSNGNGHGLNGPQQNILNQLAELEALGIPRPEKAQLALLCGYSNARSGGFTEPLAGVLNAGFVVYPTPGLVELTEAGRSQASAVARPMSAAELHERIGQKLGTPEARLLRELIAAYPNVISKEELSGKLGYSNSRSGGFTEPLGRLRSLGIAHYPAAGNVKAAEWLFF